MVGEEKSVIFGLKWGYFEDWDWMVIFGVLETGGDECRRILDVKFLSWCVDWSASESWQTANICSSFKYPLSLFIAKV